MGATVDIADTSTTVSVQIQPFHQRIITNAAINRFGTNGQNYAIDYERTGASYVAANQIFNGITTTSATADYIATALSGSTSQSIVFENQEIDEQGNLRLIYTMPGDYVSFFQENTAKQVVQQMIKQNLLIKIAKSRAQPVRNEAQANEIKARETLRDMVTESEWRRYLTNGFIMVKAPSNRWYQIFNSSSKRVIVYEANKKIAEICIHSDPSCPPTDHVINIKVLAEIDEDAIWQGGNVTKLGPSKYTQAEMRAAMQRHITEANVGPPLHLPKINKPQPKNLVEAYQSIKQIA